VAGLYRVAIRRIGRLVRSQSGGSQLAYPSASPTEDRLTPVEPEQA